MSCEDCLKRREFLIKAATAAASLAAVAGCGDGAFGPPVRNTQLPAPPTIKLSDYPALATVGQVVGLPSFERAVVRTSTSPSAFIGLNMRCTHEGCDTNVSGNEIQCPCHGSRFDAFGAVLNGPAQFALAQRTVTDNGDGTITIA